MWLRRISILLVLLASAGPAATAAERLALVIGNGAYTHAGALPNPPNDARAITAKLEAMDFEVISGIDLDHGAMRAALRRFAGMLPRAEVAVFFYAGHGLQVEGTNYLVPVDASLEDQTALSFEAVSADFVLRLMEQGERTNLVFLDACRNNPLARNLARSMGTRSAAVGRGLAQMQGGVGTLIAYATQPGNVALDGEGGNSPFTRAIVRHIDEPGLEVRQMLTRVRQSVLSETRGEQVPWDHSSLTGDFYFVSKAPEPPPPPAPAAAAAPAPPAATGGQMQAVELAYWQSAESVGSAQAYETYLGRYPDGAFADLARLKIEQAKAPPAEPANPSRQGKDGQQVAALPPAAAPAPAEPSVEAMEAPYVVTTRSNVRARPDADADLVTTFDPGTRVTVTGRVQGANWFRVRTPGGRQAYIYAPLVAPESAVPAASPSPQPPAARGEQLVYLAPIRQGGNEFPFLSDVVASRLDVLPNTRITMDPALRSRADTTVEGRVVRIDKRTRADPGAQIAQQLLGSFLSLQGARNMPTAQISDYEVEVAITAERRGSRPVTETAVIQRTLSPDEEQRGGTMMLMRAATTDAARRLARRLQGEDPGPMRPISLNGQALQ